MACGSVRWRWSGRDMLWAGSPIPSYPQLTTVSRSGGSSGMMASCWRRPKSQPRASPPRLPSPVAPSLLALHRLTSACVPLSITHVSGSDSGSVGGKTLVGCRGPVLIISCFWTKLSFQMGNCRLGGGSKSRQACLLWPPWCVFSPPLGRCRPQTEPDWALPRTRLDARLPPSTPHI